jgi:Cd2+/Zn2+-exporting ATPase
VESEPAATSADAPSKLHHGTLELEFDSDVITLQDINAYLRETGVCMGINLAHVVLKVQGILSPRQELVIEATLSKLPGVRATASFASQTVLLEFDRQRCQLPMIVDRLEKLSVTLRQIETRTAQEKLIDDRKEKLSALPLRARVYEKLPPWMQTALGSRELVLACVGALFLIAGTSVHLSDGPQWLRLSLLAVTFVTCGYHTAIDTLKTLIHLRFDIDVLMFAAAIGAALLGHYEEGALLLLLFALGGAGEDLALGRARKAIAALSAIAPRTATVLSADGELREVLVEQLAIGDRVLVHAGERLAADGEVIDGASAIDQSPITGESAPVEKAKGDAVFAGTINGQGRLVIRVTKTAADNTLAKVIRLVEEAQASRSPTQLFTDRVEKWYVPAVLIGTGLLIVLPPLLNIPARREEGSLWAGWFYQAMAFLTAASPCALAIGTPAAVLSGIGRAARGGVLIKGGAHLEALGRIKAVAFDKTGTLTRGQPRVSAVEAVRAGWDHATVLQWAAAVERGSEHPLARAIVAEADSQPSSAAIPALIVTDVHQSPGLGITATVAGRPVSVGRLDSPADAGVNPGGPDDSRSWSARAEALTAQGATVVALRVDDEMVGLIALADTVRPTAARTLAALRELGVQRTIMLTGDNHRAAAAVAKQVGVDDFHAELLPADKLALVRQLDAELGGVAMVGDGVNDAPALAGATVGIAVGGAAGTGSDVALETADVALLADDLGKLPEAIGVGRFTRRIITQNLVIALGVIGVMAPLAALGFAPIAVAVLLHEGSTVVVVLNALRVLGYRPPNPAAPLPG